MIKQNQKVLNLALIAVDWFCMAMAHLLSYCFSRKILGNAVSLWSTALLYVALIVANTVLLYFMELYGARRSKPFRKELWLIFVDACVILTGILLLQAVIQHTLFPWFFLLLLSAFYFSIDGGIRFFLRKLLRFVRKQGYNQKYLLLVGDGNLCRQFIQAVERNPQYGYRFYGCLSDHLKCGDFVEKVPVVGNIRSISQHLSGGNVDEVVIAVSLEEYAKMEYIIGRCEKGGIKINVIPAFYQYLPSNPRMDEFDGIPFMILRKIPLSNLFYAALKRIFDVVGSIVCLTCSMPLIVVVTAVLYCTGGTVIYKQERIGLSLQPFTMYKFRTMENPGTSSEWTKKKDPRRTRFGIFLRKFSIDELPQFINVLKGEMSIVGPRPEIKEFVNQFQQTIPRYMVRHQVKPGITGWAQINNLRGDTSIEERIKSDIYYIENWSLSLDLRIILKTLTKEFYNPYE